MLPTRRLASPPPLTTCARPPARPACHPLQRVGLVGANGAGKSTLLKALGGLRRVDAGRLVVSNQVQMGYLAQTAVSGSTKTVYDEVRGAMTALVAAEAALEAAGAAAEAGVS